MRDAVAGAAVLSVFGPLASAFAAPTSKDLEAALVTTLDYIGGYDPKTGFRLSEILTALSKARFESKQSTIWEIHPNGSVKTEDVFTNIRYISPDKSTVIVWSAYYQADYEVGSDKETRGALAQIVEMGPLAYNGALIKVRYSRKTLCETVWRANEEKQGFAKPDPVFDAVMKFVPSQNLQGYTFPTINPHKLADSLLPAVGDEKKEPVDIFDYQEPNDYFRAKGNHGVFYIDGTGLPHAHVQARQVFWLVERDSCYHHVTSAKGYVAKPATEGIRLEDLKYMVASGVAGNRYGEFTKKDQLASFRGSKSSGVLVYNDTAGALTKVEDALEPFSRIGQVVYEASKSHPQPNRDQWETYTELQRDVPGQITRRIYTGGKLVSTTLEKAGPVTEPTPKR
ncbi:hypothetical protein HZB01_02020 [Candidatus Woesearchaeota archaeon]|nr:hypothetical protein [Candidatus Woesearchaeota archaeon]